MLKLFNRIYDLNQALISKLSSLRSLGRRVGYMGKGEWGFAGIRVLRIDLVDLRSFDTFAKRLYFLRGLKM